MTFLLPSNLNAKFLTACSLIKSSLFSQAVGMVHFSLRGAWVTELMISCRSFWLAEKLRLLFPRHQRPSLKVILDSDIVRLIKCERD